MPIAAGAALSAMLSVTLICPPVSKLTPVPEVPALRRCENMKRSASGILSHLRAMPGTLKGVTITLWVCGVLSMVASVLPGWRDESGRAVTLRELWYEGSGPPIIACGLVWVLIGTLIYRGSAWVRHALMLSIVAAGLSGFFRKEYEGVPIGLVATVTGIAIFLGARYLYFCPEVISYFTRGSSNAESG